MIKQCDIDYDQILHSCEDSIIDKFVIQGRNVVVSYNNNVLKDLQLKFAFVLIIDEFNYMIVVDDIFMDCSSTTKDFIIEHEVGHILLHMNNQINFIEKMRRFFVELININLYEFEADNYALKKVGKDSTLQAFEEILLIRKSKLMKLRFQKINERMKKL